MRSWLYRNPDKPSFHQLYQQAIDEFIQTEENWIGPPGKRTLIALRDLPRKQALYQINNGLCEDFADYAYWKILPFYPNVDQDLTHGHHQETYGGVDFPSHKWLVFEGKCYDAEASQGVDDWWLLPIFARQNLVPPPEYRDNPFTCDPYPFLRNPLSYRRNSDVELRKAEQRYRASNDFYDKLHYNILALRNGRIPPPDVDVEIVFDEESILGWGALYHELDHLMKPGARHRWHRKWYFPNGLGFVASYNVLEPLPGQARDVSNLSAEEHELDTTAFYWWDAESHQPRMPKSPEHYYGRDLPRLRVRAFPENGAPEHEYISRTVTRFPLIEEDTLLEMLQEVAGTDFEDRYDLFPYDFEDDED